MGSREGKKSEVRESPLERGKGVVNRGRKAEGMQLDGGSGSRGDQESEKPKVRVAGFEPGTFEILGHRRSLESNTSPRLEPPVNKRRCSAFAIGGAVRPGIEGRGPRSIEEGPGSVRTGSGPGQDRAVRTRFGAHRSCARSYAQHEVEQGRRRAPIGKHRAPTRPGPGLDRAVPYKTNSTSKSRANIPTA